MRYTVSASFLLLGLLSACATPGELPPNPALLQADAGQAALSRGAATWPRQDWWQGLVDHQLDALMARALADSPNLQAAAARLAAAQALSQRADARRQPQLSLGGELTEQRYTANGSIPPPVAGSVHSSATFRLDATYELDFWGRNQAALDAALSREQAAQAEVQEARLLLSTAIGRAYVELARLHQQSLLLQEKLAQQQAQLALRHQLQQAGLGSETEVAALDSQLAGTRQSQLAVASAQLRQRHQLAALAGQTPQFGEQLVAPALPESAEAALPAVLPADLLGRRPDLVAARWRVEATRGDERVARADFYPNVNLFAFAGLSSLGLEHLLQASSAMAGLGPAVHLPLFDGGQRQAQLARSHADEALAIAEYNQTLLRALQQVADQASTLQSLGAQSEAADEARQQAERALALTRTRRRAGLASELAVLEAQTPWLAARSASLLVAEQQWLARIALIQALGGGYRTDVLPPSPQKSST